MTSALLIEDRLTETERKMEGVSDQGGIYIVANRKGIAHVHMRQPPSLEDIQDHILARGAPVDSTPMKEKPGIHFWTLPDMHHATHPVVEILYEEYGHLFIQDQLGTLVVVTKVNECGRIRLMTELEAENAAQWIRVRT